MGTANLGTIDIGTGQSVQLGNVNLVTVDVSNNVPYEGEATTTTAATTTTTAAQQYGFETGQSYAVTGGETNESTTLGTLATTSTLEPQIRSKVLLPIINNTVRPVIVSSNPVTDNYETTA